MVHAATVQLSLAARRAGAVARIGAIAYLGIACSKEDKPRASDILLDRQGQTLDHSSTRNASDDAPVALGEIAKTRHYEMVFTNVKRCTVAAPFRPRHDMIKLGVDVKITGTSQVEVPVNPFYATLEAPSGRRYSSTLAGCDPVLQPVRLTAGKSARGWITFDVPAEHRALTMIYAPNLIGAGVQEVRFKLR